MCHCLTLSMSNWFLLWPSCLLMSVCPSVFVLSITKRCLLSTAFKACEEEEVGQELVLQLQTATYPHLSMCMSSNSLSTRRFIDYVCCLLLLGVSVCAYESVSAWCRSHLLKHGLQVFFKQWVPVGQCFLTLMHEAWAEQLILWVQSPKTTMPPLIWEVLLINSGNFLSCQLPQWSYTHNEPGSSYVDLRTCRIHVVF